MLVNSRGKAYTLPLGTEQTVLDSLTMQGTAVDPIQRQQRRR
jgi:hypothetical protein